MRQLKQRLLNKWKINIMNKSFNNYLIVFSISLLLVGFSFPPKLYDDIQVGEQITYKNNETTLSGSLLHPGNNRAPVVIILLGSGDTTHRKSWLSTNRFPWHKFIADVFLKHNIAVLFLDKRGIGQSDGHWRESNFNDRADDVLAAITYIKTRPDIDLNSIGLMGISQGAWVSYIVASNVSNISFLVLLGAPTVSVKEQIFDDRLLHYMDVHSNQQQINQKVLEYEKWLNKKMNGNKKADYISKIINFEPAPYLNHIKTIPTIAFYGEYDHFVPPEDFELRNQLSEIGFSSSGNIPRLQSIFKSEHAKNLTIYKLKEAGHGMVIAENNGTQIWDKGFADNFMDKLESWIIKTITSKGKNEN